MLYFFTQFKTFLAKFFYTLMLVTKIGPFFFAKNCSNLMASCMNGNLAKAYLHGKSWSIAIRLPLIQPTLIVRLECFFLIFQNFDFHAEKPLYIFSF